MREENISLCSGWLGKDARASQKGMGVKEEVMKGIMRVTYTAFTFIHLVPVAFDPILHFNLLDSQQKGLNWDVFQRQVDEAPTELPLIETLKRLCRRLSDSVLILPSSWGCVVGLNTLPGAAGSASLPIPDCWWSWDRWTEWSRQTPVFPGMNWNCSFLKWKASH